MKNKLQKLQELFAKNAKVPLLKRMEDYNKRLAVYSRELDKIQKTNGIKIEPKEAKSNHGTRIGVTFSDTFKDSKTYEKREIKCRKDIEKLVEKTLIAPDAVISRYIIHQTELAIIPQDLKFGPIVDEYFADEEQQNIINKVLKKK